MVPRVPTAYTLKRAALYPRILLGRHRERGQADFMRQALELTNYSRGAYEFIGARMQNPDLLYDFDVAQGGVVLDVGAYVGAWAGSLAARAPGAAVHSFELSPRIAAVLRESVAAEPRITVHGYGLGGRDRVVRVSRKDKGSSNHNIVAAADSDEGQIRDIAAVWEELGLGRVAAMKINIEGGEYELLDRMAAVGLLPHVETYLIQFHEWIRGSYRNRRRIRRALARTHDPVWEYPFVWERWQRRGG